TSSRLQVSPRGVHRRAGALIPRTGGYRSSRGVQLAPAVAPALVIIADANGLHEGQDDGRAHEAEAPPLQILGERDLVGESPDVPIERTVLATYIAESLCIRDRRLDLRPIADDRRVLHE